MSVVYGMNVRPLSGLATKIKIVDGDFDKVKALADSEGLKVDPTYLPKHIEWMDGNELPPGDFDKTPWMNVSKRAMEAIAELEPGVHQFVPVEYLDQRGRHLENRFWFITGQIIDSVDREHTNLIFHLNSWRPAKDVARRYPELLPDGVDLKAEPKLVLNLDQIGDAHLWYDSYAGTRGKGSPPWMSQAMHDHLQDKDLTGLNYNAGQLEAVR